MLRFLVVDDDHQVSAVLQAGLEEFCGAAVTCANTGSAAVQILRAKRFDLAVIDVLLPDMSGFELAEWSAANCNLPILLISGHLETQASCKLYGYPHLAKPFSLNELAKAAMAAMSNSRENIDRIHRSHAQLMATAQQPERAASESRSLLIRSISSLRSKRKQHLPSRLANEPA